MALKKVICQTDTANELSSSGLMTSSSLGITLNYLAKEDVNAMNLPLIQRLEIICLFTFLFRTLSQ